MVGWFPIFKFAKKGRLPKNYVELETVTRNSISPAVENPPVQEEDDDYRLYQSDSDEEEEPKNVEGKPSPTAQPADSPSSELKNVHEEYQQKISDLRTKLSRKNKAFNYIKNNRYD